MPIADNVIEELLVDVFSSDKTRKVTTVFVKVIQFLQRLSLNGSLNEDPISGRQNRRFVFIYWIGKDAKRIGSNPIPNLICFKGASRLFKSIASP